MHSNLCHSLAACKKWNEWTEVREVRWVLVIYLLKKKEFNFQRPFIISRNVYLPFDVTSFFPLPRVILFLS